MRSRSRRPGDLEGHCLRCYQRREACFCDVIPSILTRTRFVIVRHILEERRTSNTARIAALAMPNCEILGFGGGAPFDEKPLVEPGTWLLFPGAAPYQPGAEAPRRVVVLDGTWRQARRMVIKIKALHTMPRLSLPPPAVAPRRLREPTIPEGMSTLEAIAAAVRALEGEELAGPLDRTFAEMVDRALRLRRGAAAVG